MGYALTRDMFPSVMLEIDENNRIGLHLEKMLRRDVIIIIMIMIRKIGLASDERKQL